MVGLSSVPLINAAGEFKLVRQVLATTVTMTAGSPTLSALQILCGSGGSFPANLRTFLGSFDLAALDRVVVTFLPRWSSNLPNNAEIPQLYLVANYDDITTPPSVDYVLGQGGSKMHWFRSPVNLIVSPRALMIPAGSTTSSVISTAPWYNTSMFTSTAAFLPICKFAIPAVTNLPAAGAFDIYYTFHFRLRQAITG